MKVSRLWLNEWVDCSWTEQELAEQLTMAGLEVDAVSPVAGEFTQVVVAEVIDTKPHPDADKLTLCEVRVNENTMLNIVCGAANVRPKLKVALAMIGAKLPGDFIIKESKLRGQLSQGMLCSLSELGLADSSEGIMELEADAPLGMDLRKYLALDDYVLDIELTPNRADCFSLLGIAREISALSNRPLLIQPISEIAPQLDEILPIHIQDTKACARYCGRVIRGINPEATTPVWMSERLRRGGIRALHPVVDVLNYVMLELGQPMHAFDLSTIKGPIEVRFAKDSETLNLLNGQEINLNNQVLIIADQDKPLALAGIMGGEYSAVQAETQDIFLESAFFNPITCAGVARAYGLFSDASQRFERGVDPNLPTKALARATELILTIAGGRAGPVNEVSDTVQLPKQVGFHFNINKVKQLTGLSIPTAEIKRLLEGLGIVILTEKQDILEVSIPSYRFDIQQDVDLVEEVIRLYGYDNLPVECIKLLGQPGQTSIQEELKTKLGAWFSAKGYQEIISYSFVDPELQESLYPEREVMQLLNPISAELSQMRLGMWPGLIAAMIYNLHRQQQRIKFFELGVVFDVAQKKLTERSCVAGLMMGEYGDLNWSESKGFFDFFDLKGDMQSLFAFLKLNDCTFVAAEHDALHPGQSAQIIREDRSIGWIGVLHPRLSDALDVQQDVVLFELDLVGLVNSKAPNFKAISKYPNIRRDLSFLVDKKINAAAIEETVRAEIKEDWLKSFDLFDVYMGTGIPEDKKSMAIGMTLQDAERTLVDAEINSLIGAIIKSLEDKFSIVLRD